jgi:hypothetical protein
MTAPKVFLSHASEDKDRFVLGFARQLRESGVDVWLDQWEMKPGDSLVDKIYEEGLKDARAVIIVLSTVSVQKPWVREELNASVVNRISRGTKLIGIHLCHAPMDQRIVGEKRLDDGQTFARTVAPVDLDDHDAVPLMRARMEKSVSPLSVEGDDRA